jgi:hypothetical protein
MAAFLYGDKIMTSIKDALGVTQDDTGYDTELAIHISSALSTVNQVIENSAAFQFTPESTWANFDLGWQDVNNVYQYVFLAVKIMFDPPAAAAMASLEKVRDEALWRIKTYDERNHIYPTP